MPDALKKLGVTLGGWTPDALMIGGGAALAFGAGQVYAPAGWIVAGLLLILAGFLAAKAR